MTALCNLNGVIRPEKDSSIPVLDRGFLFGDSVYEVMRTRDSTPFAWQEHLDRLRVSAEGIGIQIELSDREIMTRVHETLAASGSEEKYVRIIITRGTGSAPNIDLGCAKGPQNVVILVRELPDYQGLQARLAVVPRLRTDRRSLDPAIKSGNYLNNVLGLAEAKAAGATDCLFLNAEGKVTEASTSNFFLIRNGEVLTPPLSAGLLAGITRRMLFDCLGQSGQSPRECDLGPGDVQAADEVFLSSTLRDIYPVVSVDGREMSGGAIGPRTEEIRGLFAEYCRRKVAEVDGPAYQRLIERA
ncbi:MAG: aminotransferase class IV [Planctomycetota bacterium]|jgi:branched-chain amino acid aminotransferase